MRRRRVVAVAADPIGGSCSEWDCEARCELTVTPGEAAFISFVSLSSWSSA